MKIKNILLTLAILLCVSSSVFAAQSLGVVNFMQCITDSKYGKNEQAQLESIKKQWTDLIEQSENEFKEINKKFDDQDYLDSLSPEAEEEMKMKQKALSDDIAKYQNHLYQILNQANYFFIQKMSSNISKASEKIAQDRKLDLILNKEACFYNNPRIDITKLVIKEMDHNFEKETAKNDVKVEEQMPNVAPEPKEVSTSPRLKTGA